jgi:hypothetical protein
MYSAKHSGRDRLVRATPLSDATPFITLIRRRGGPARHALAQANEGR